MQKLKEKIALAGFLLLRFLGFSRTQEACRKALPPMVLACHKYFMSLMRCGEPDNTLIEKLWHEGALWMERAGLEQRLQPGYQFFIARCLEMGDVLLSLHYAMRNLLLKFEMDFLRSECAECISVLNAMFGFILSVLHLEQGAEDKVSEFSDFPDKLSVLEKKLREKIPVDFEWAKDTEEARAWLRLADVVCCFEDLRFIMLRMAETF